MITDLATFIIVKDAMTAWDTSNNVHISPVKHGKPVVALNNALVLKVDVGIFGSCEELYPKYFYINFISNR